MSAASQSCLSNSRIYPAEYTCAFISLAETCELPSSVSASANNDRRSINYYAFASRHREYQRELAKRNSIMIQDEILQHSPSPADSRSAITVDRRPVDRLHSSSQIKLEIRLRLKPKDTEENGKYVRLSAEWWPSHSSDARSELWLVYSKRVFKSRAKIATCDARRLS